jgi:hypothetical protein
VRRHSAWRLPVIDNGSTATIPATGDVALSAAT